MKTLTILLLCLSLYCQGQTPNQSQSWGDWQTRFTTLSVYDLTPKTGFEKWCEENSYPRKMIFHNYEYQIVDRDFGMIASKENGKWIIVDAEKALEQMLRSNDATWKAHQDLQNKYYEALEVIKRFSPKSFEPKKDEPKQI